MKYFDPRAILFARHAQHIVLVHFPIALLITSLVFDVWAQCGGRQALAMAGKFNLYAAAWTAPLAAATGLLAWRWQLEGAKLKGALLLHLCGASIVLVLSCGLAWFRARTHLQDEVRLPWGYFAVAAVTVAIVALTAHLGGIISGVAAPGG